MCKMHVEYFSVVFSAKSSELPPEAVLAVKFLDLYTTFSKNSQECFTQIMPEEIFHLYQTLAPSAF